MFSLERRRAWNIRMYTEPRKEISKNQRVG